MPQDTGKNHRCRRCERIKPLDAFQPSVATRRVWICRECYHEIYAENYRTNRAYVDAVKLERGCADCGYKGHPSALEFDHLPGTVKHSKISVMVGAYGLEKIKAEIAKCEVVCANCHAIRTVTRGGNAGFWADRRGVLSRPGEVDPQMRFTLEVDE